MDFRDTPTRICPPPSDALRRAIWPELFREPAPERVAELSPEEVAELVGDDCRATAEYPVIQEGAP